MTLYNIITVKYYNKNYENTNTVLHLQGVSQKLASYSLTYSL